MMKNIKILLVDDDWDNSTLLKCFIEAEGYEVYYAENGRDGLKQYEETKPDLILLDINMPEMNGFEMAKAITIDVPLPIEKLCHGKQVACWIPRRNQEVPAAMMQ